LQRQSVQSRWAARAPRIAMATAFAWRARLLPRVRKCYEVLHATEDLVAGIDNAFFAPDAAKEATVNILRARQEASACGGQPRLAPLLPAETP